MFPEFYEELISASRGLPESFVSAEKAEKYYIHINELEEKGKLFNLTAITDRAEAIRKHTVDSLHLAKTVAELSAEEKTLIDVGSGGGFPALPVAVACGIPVTALDSTAKKCEFISSVAEKCGVDVKTLPERAEEAVASRRETFDFATARAVARLNILAELCAPFVKVGGCFLAMKGSAADEELNEAKSAVAKLGLEFQRAERYEIEDGGERSILIFKKVVPTPSEFPRRFAQIKKRPL
ncbi:MAG: 16S rRNA (guanine(527)-N(7))-methyltransferase RsmG [Clostridia bacterium]|nr:16S rRNA (guanine(527)-N(7))-methyltransferase RsmG [Clostridia bacterium]